VLPHIIFWGKGRGKGKVAFIRGFLVRGRGGLLEEG